jgi:nickel-dependent lactate racemase
MVDVWLPYGKTEVCVRVPARNLIGIIEPKVRAGALDPTAEVEHALREPIPAGTKKLNEIVHPESKIAIVVDDATRKSPTELMITVVLNELNAAGVKDENITAIFGCGTHRAATEAEAKLILGGNAYNRIKHVSHDCKAADLVLLEPQSTETRFYLNRAFVEPTVRILACA